MYTNNIYENYQVNLPCFNQQDLNKTKILIKKMIFAVYLPGNYIYYHQGGYLLNRHVNLVTSKSPFDK